MALQHIRDKGVKKDMSLTERLIGTYISFLVGSWVVSWGMHANGSDSYLPGLYTFVTVARWLLLSPILFFALICVLEVWPKLLAELQHRSLEERDDPQLARDVALRREKQVQENRREREEQEIQKRIREKKEKEEREKRMEEMRLRTLKEKQMRSTEQAARSALDDF